MMCLELDDGVLGGRGGGYRMGIWWKDGGMGREVQGGICNLQFKYNTYLAPFKYIT